MRTPIVRQRGGIVKILVILILLGAGGYGLWHYWQGKKAAENAPPPVLTETVRRGEIRQKIHASGTVTASRKVDVGAQVSGEIDALYVAIGDELKAGDPIANIDASTQRNSEATAQAQLASREAALTAAKAQLAEAKQKRTRQQTLLNKGAASRESLEAADAALKNAQGAVEQAQAAVRQSRIDVETAGLNLGHTRVTAPMDGTVIAVPVEKGQTVNAMQTAPTLITLADLSTMTVKAEIAEADVGKVKAGMKASFTLLGDTRKRYESTLKSIDPAPLAVSDNSTTNDNAVYYYGHIDIDNAERTLRIGMTANIDILIAEAKDTLIIPLTALQDEGEDDQVLVPGENGEPVPRKIRLGLQDGIHAEVLEGLGEGEEVVVSQAGKNRAVDPFGGKGMF